MRVLRKVLVLCILVCGVTFLGPAPKAWSISLPLASVNAQTVDHASNEELSMCKWITHITNLSKRCIKQDTHRDAAQIR
jgi:hypothetical protein